MATAAKKVQPQVGRGAGAGRGSAEGKGRGSGGEGAGLRRGGEGLRRGRGGAPEGRGGPPEGKGRASGGGGAGLRRGRGGPHGEGRRPRCLRNEPAEGNPSPSLRPVSTSPRSKCRRFPGGLSAGHLHAASSASLRYSNPVGAGRSAVWYVGSAQQLLGKQGIRCLSSFIFGVHRLLN